MIGKKPRGPRLPPEVAAEVASLHTYILYPPQSDLANARLFAGVMAHSLTCKDKMGRKDMVISLTADQFQRMRGAFPEIPAEGPGLE